MPLFLVHYKEVIQREAFVEAPYELAIEQEIARYPAGGYDLLEVGEEIGRAYDVNDLEIIPLEDDDPEYGDCDPDLVLS